VSKRYMAVKTKDLGQEVPQEILPFNRTIAMLSSTVVSIRGSKRFGRYFRLTTSCLTQSPELVLHILMNVPSLQLTESQKVTAQGGLLQVVSEVMLVLWLNRVVIASPVSAFASTRPFGSADTRTSRGP
jgi:hypothetical protein